MKLVELSWVLCIVWWHKGNFVLSCTTGWEECTLAKKLYFQLNVLTHYTATTNCLETNPNNSFRHWLYVQFFTSYKYKLLTQRIKYCFCLIHIRWRHCNCHIVANYLSFFLKSWLNTFLMLCHPGFVTPDKLSLLHDHLRTSKAHVRSAYTVVLRKRAHGQSTLQVFQGGGWALFRLFPHLTTKECPRHVYSDLKPSKQILDMN